MNTEKQIINILLDDILDFHQQLTKCERKAPKFIYGDISSLKNLVAEKTPTRLKYQNPKLGIDV